jgi:hypothetical protein
MTTKYIDYLTEDEAIPGQKYVCLSFVSPEGIKNCTMRGLKIRGVFNELDKANKHAEKLRKGDPDFDVFVGEVGKWLPWDPAPENVEEENYQEKELNSLVKAYKEQMDKSKEAFDVRKEELMKKIEDEEEAKLKQANKLFKDGKKVKKMTKSDIEDMKRRLEQKEKELLDAKTETKEASQNQ